MKYLLFAVLFFGLPHVDWIPRRLGIELNAIPLGLGNWLLAAAFVLWVIGLFTRSGAPNPFRSFTVFVVIVTLWIGVAVGMGLSPELRDILTPAKDQLSLLLLYYLPLATLRNERDMSIVLGIALLVHAGIGLQVARSGVLGGSSFNLGKRGSGPFGEDWKGSDIAGAYLAQTIMLPLGLLFAPTVPIIARAAAMGATGLMILGLFATYSRGAAVAVGAGFLMIVVARGIKLRAIAIGAVVLLGSLWVLPGGLRQRIDETVDEEGTLDISSQGRFMYAQTAWGIFKEHPFGVGTGQTKEAVGRVLEREVDVHNAFLQTLVEYGVFGLPVLLLALAAMGWSAFTMCRDVRLPWTCQAYALGMVGFLATLAACNMFYSNLYKNTVLGTVTMHLGVLAWMYAKRKSLITKSEEVPKGQKAGSSHA